MVRKYVQCPENSLPKNVVFYGEVYGLGIQKMIYNESSPVIKIFAAAEDGEYKSVSYLKEICAEMGISVVDFISTEFLSVDYMRTYAEESSEYYKGFKEGIVITDAENPNIMAKLKSQKYLEKFTR